MGAPSYRVLYTKSAAKKLRKLERRYRAAIISAIEELAWDPRPNGVEKLRGGEKEYRIRVGSYRVIYEISDNELIVLVLKVGHRREVYR